MQYGWLHFKFSQIFHDYIHFDKHLGTILHVKIEMIVRELHLKPTEKLLGSAETAYFRQSSNLHFLFERPWPIGLDGTDRRRTFFIAFLD